ncbi:hypothetical protein DPEC_G00039480 [Dallia pectoralis]|uniref:Uncharacterized protein n=1 Tax=Dallia pectoralis TaxID=75939 RepID=A0ACC2HEF0_DALPE|nr:hypothetical protein DPEC_G00039480 [Dallia pectoralis]
MESTGLEELQLEVIRASCLLPRESLVELCDYLIIAGAEFEHVNKKGRTALITLISNHIQREELEDKGMADLLYLQDKISELQIAGKAGTSKQVGEQQDGEEEKILEGIEALQLQLASARKQRENNKPDTKGIKSITHTRQSPQNVVHSPALHPWHKDFKIAGQIGEPGQKDKLTFSSLARQIEHGLSKGFPELEIVDAVIRAISPGMQLRSYLEGKTNLTLPTLRRILRCHYQEKSATELYKQLTSEVQGIKETPQNFFIRTFDLRQKILFASQESESGLQYDPGLVQKMFLHTVLTGLQNDNIRRDLQPYLEQADISDELLLERVNTACAYETERQNKKKLSGQQRPVTIHSVQSSDAPAEKNENPPTQQKPKVSPAVLSQLEEIRSEMALLKDLKAEVSHIRESMQQPQHMPRQLPPAGGGDGASGLQFSGQQVQDPAQGYWFTGGPGHRGGTAQYQQRFAPQPSFPYQIVVKGENVLVVNRVELKIIARTVIGVAVASTFWLVVEQEDRDSLEVSR